MAHPNVALVERMIECFNRGDMETLKREILAEDIEWRLPGHHPLAGTKHGADEVIAFFQQLARAGIRVELSRIDSFGEDSVVEVHRGHGQVGGVRFDVNNCTLYRIVDGRIQEVQVYSGDQHAVDLFFHQAYQLAPIPRRLAE